MQRFCLTLKLYPDPQLVAEYVERHRRVWPEVLQSQLDAGVTGMEIYELDGNLVMVMDTNDDFTFEKKAAMDRANPKVMEWESEMAKYQVSDPSADASVKWRSMRKIFDLQADGNQQTT
jgi:L-rhamnose mutarotase